MPRTTTMPITSKPMRQRGAPPSPTRGMPRGGGTQKSGNPFAGRGVPALPKRSQKKGA